MSKEIKFTAEELESVSSIKSSFESLTFKFGQVELEIQNLELEKTKLKEELVLVKANESKTIANITTKYGDGTLDPESGVFISK
jgi:K+/H+ antiporter YhaU regulatory subunit KhtT